MKKITKRLMALMLSLVMVFGCVPNFVNIVNANDEKTLAEILNTAEGGFPSKIEDAWSNGNDCFIYYDNNILNVIKGGSVFSQYQGDDVYKLTDDHYEKVTSGNIELFMTDNKLTSIVLTGSAGGTYVRVLKTINVVYNHAIDTLDDANELITLANNDKGSYISSNLAVDTDKSSFSITPMTSHPWIKFIYTYVKFTDNSLNDAKSVDEIYLNGVKIVNEEDSAKQTEKALKLEPFWYYASLTGTHILATPIDCGISLEMNVSGIEAGKSVKDITATFGRNEERDAFYSRYGYITVTDDEGTPINDNPFEAGKTYTFHFRFNLGSNIAMIKITNIDTYKEAIVNGTHISRLNTPADDNYLTIDPGELGVFYTCTIPAAPSSGSKTYKATNTNKTAEKISGSGKKGSKRTITPIEGKKVGKVTVTDKNGNKVEVTPNADGTYSFIQPASNVDVEVTYVNREITLTIGSTEADVDGERSNLDVSPVIRNDRTMLPIRFVAENLGAKVEWNEKSPDYVLITKGDIKIEITLGSDAMKVNGKEVKLDSVAFAENDRTYLPVRAVSENLNAVVEWNESRPMEVKIYER